ncbi:MAG: Oligopeptide transport system permease protein OppC, partial [uncultured Nocardioidaceae bacterium]
EHHCQPPEQPVVLAAGHEAEALHLRVRRHRARRRVRDPRAVPRAVRRERDRRGAVLQDRGVRHRQRRPGRAQPAHARRPGGAADLGARDPAGHGPGDPHRRRRRLQRRLVGRGPHAAQRRPAGLPADPARPGRADGAAEPRGVGHRRARRRLPRPARGSRLPRCGARHRVAGLRGRRRSARGAAVARDRGRGAAEHDRAAAGRGRPAAHLLDRRRRRARLPGLRGRPRCGQLGPDDEREPAGPPDPAVGGARTGAHDRDLHHRHEPDGRRAGPAQPEGRRL